MVYRLEHTFIKNCRFSADSDRPENDVSDVHGLLLPQDAGVLGDLGAVNLSGLALSNPDAIDQPPPPPRTDTSKSESELAAVGSVPAAGRSAPRPTLPPPAPPELPPHPLLTLLQPPPPPHGTLSAASGEASAKFPPPS